MRSEGRAPWARERGGGPPWERWFARSKRRLPWPSTLAVAVFQQVGGHYAALDQPAGCRSTPSRGSCSPRAPPSC